MKIMLIFIFLTEICMSDWSTIKNTNFRFPQHVYQYSLNLYDYGVVQFSWDYQKFSSPISVWFYYENSNILSQDQAFGKCYFNSTQRNCLFQAQNAGKCYIRVIPINIGYLSNFEYNITIQISDPDGILYLRQSYMNNFLSTQSLANNSYSFLSLNNLYTSASLRFNIQIDSVNVILFDSSSNSTYYLTSNKQFCPPQRSNPSWYIFIVNKLASIKSSTNYTFTLQQNNLTSCVCSSGYYWSSETMLCQKSPVNILAIILGVIGGFLLIVAIIVIICCIRYRNSLQKIQFTDKNDLYVKRQAPQHIKPNVQTCSICLEQQTDVVLSCLHKFHQECIEAWMKKSNLCPVCRIQLNNSNKNQNPNSNLPNSSSQIVIPIQGHI